MLLSLGRSSIRVLWYSHIFNFVKNYERFLKENIHCCSSCVHIFSFNTVSHLDIIILQYRHGVLYWLANYYIYTIRNGTVRRWRRRVTFGRLTLMFRFSLSGRSLQTRGLGRNFSVLLSLAHSAHYYLLSLLLH